MDSVMVDMFKTRISGIMAQCMCTYLDSATMEYGKGCTLVYRSNDSKIYIYCKQMNAMKAKYAYEVFPDSTMRTRQELETSYNDTVASRKKNVTVFTDIDKLCEELKKKFW